MKRMVSLEKFSRRETVATVALNSFCFEEKKSKFAAGISPRVFGRLSFMDKFALSLGILIVGYAVTLVVALLITSFIAVC